MVAANQVAIIGSCGVPFLEPQALIGVPVGLVPQAGVGQAASFIERVGLLCVRSKQSGLQFQQR